MKKRWLIGLLIIILFTVSYLIPQQVEASAALHVEAEIGVENRVKREMPTFIQFTITNNGEPFSGDLVVDAEIRYDVGSALVYPLDIATGETKTMTVYIDGFSDRYTYTTPVPDLFHFYEGGIEKGKKIKYEGDHSVNPRIFEPFVQMGLVVTTKKDEVSALDRMGTYATDDVELFYVNDKNNAYFTEDARSLSMIDFIVFDDIAVHDLTEKQQQALLQWVQQGGKISFAPNASGANATGVFADYLPLTLADDKVSLSVESLNKYVAANAQIELPSVYKATLNEGAKDTLVLDQTTVAGAMPVGKGQVIQLTFPLNDPIMTKLSGYGRVIVDIFDINATQNYNADYLKYGFAPDWVYTNELFDTFRINIGLLIGGIVLYIIIIGPVLYMVLKRKDKREKMWIYVPIIAIVTSLLFFVFGARDRLFNPQIEQMAMYEVQEDGTLMGTFTNALLSNKSGDFAFQVAEGTSVSAASSNGIGTNELHLKSYVKETADGSLLTLRNMDYWSVESMVGETVLADVGQLTSDLTLENNQLTGTITNGLPVDLQGVNILAGRDEIEIGPIKAGETVDVKQEVQKQYLAKPYYYDPYYAGQQQPQTDFTEARLERFKSSAITANDTHKGPILVGWSDVSLVPVEFEGNAKQHTISYFVQPIQPKIILAEEVSFTVEDTVPYIDSADGNSWGHIEENDPLKAYLSEGVHNAYYDFVTSDEMKNMNWKALEIDYDDSIIEVELYNHATGDYMKLEDGKLQLTENIQPFVEQELHLQLQMKITRIGMDDGQLVPLPTFTLKGEPKQ